jgi:signal transduction histidine kinase
LRNQGVRIVRRFEGEAPVSGFPAELRQVFSNLLINAAEAAERNMITIHVYPSRLWNGNSWGTRVVIADSGPGIPPDIRKHIFEPFFTTKGDKGSGVGLWVSLGIVEKHKGVMRVFSRTGPSRTGTVFSVFLPQVGPQVETPHERRKRVRTERYPVQMGLDLPASG